MEDEIIVEQAFPFVVLLNCTTCGMTIKNAFTGQKEIQEWIDILTAVRDETYICGNCRGE